MVSIVLAVGFTALLAYLPAKYLFDLNMTEFNRVCQKKARREQERLALIRQTEADFHRSKRECQEFRVRACIMGTKEITHGTTKRADYPR